jgi:hypothetical protein
MCFDEVLSASFFGILKSFGVFSLLTMYIILIFILKWFHTSPFTIRESIRSLMFIVQTSNLNELSWNVLGFVRTAQALHFWVLIWNLEFEILSSFLPLQWLWIWSPTNSLGELNIFGHNGYPFRVKSAKIGVFKESDQISLRSLLQC